MRLRFLTGGGQELFLDELGPLLRHPYLLAVYIGSIAVYFAASALFGWQGHTGATFAMLVPLVVLAKAIGVLCFLGMVHLCAALFPRAERVVTFLALPVAVNVVTALATTWVLLNLLLDISPPPALAMLATLLLVIAFEEAALTFVGSRHGHLMAEEVRHYLGSATLRPAAVADQLLIAGETEVANTAVLRVQAQGNYVRIWTDSGSFEVPGPFSALLARLPGHLGCLVRRSDWVATRAVAGTAREGRMTVLRLSDGNIIPVASTRTAELRDWLSQFSPPAARRRGQSAGGGETKRQSRPAPDNVTSAIGGTTPSAPSAAVNPVKS